MGNTTLVTEQEGRFYKNLPKVHLHSHILGMVKPQTVIDLARKNRIDIGTDDQASLYTYYDFRAFIDLTCKIAAVMRSEDDFSRVIYEAIEADYRESRVLYSELFVQTSMHLLFGVPHEVVVAGFADGVQRAERDFGVRTRLIEGINRTLPRYFAVETVRRIVASRSPFFIGIGLDDFEPAGPPELFIEAFELARAEGLHRTAHAGEHGPAQNVVTSLSVLKCERIDHGYQVVTDAAISYRLADNGVHFTACPTVSSRQGWNRSEGHVLKQMRDRNLWISINADDGAVIKTTLAREYALAQKFMGATQRDMAEISLRAIDATWLAPSEKHALRQRFITEFRNLPELENVRFD